jgi:hypothetical protein
MKIVQATAEDAEEIHGIQIRYLEQQPDMTAMQKAESVSAIQHLLQERTCVKAVEHGMIVGVARGHARGKSVFIDALWVPDFTVRQKLCVRLLLELERQFSERSVFHIRAVHRDVKCFRVYTNAGYSHIYDERRDNGVILRLYEKSPFDNDF